LAKVRNFDGFKKCVACVYSVGVFN